MILLFLFTILLLNLLNTFFIYKLKNKYNRLEKQHEDLKKNIDLINMNLTNRIK